MCVYTHPTRCASLSELAELCDVLTVEIEHVNCEILSTLEGRGVRVQPSPRTISVVQDKYKQKEHFKEVCDVFRGLQVCE